MGMSRMRLSGPYDVCQERPGSAKLPPVSVKLLVSMKMTQTAYPRENPASSPSPNVPFSYHLCFLKV